MFTRTKSHFRCHLRRVAPSFLYQLWFDIIVPGTALRSSRFYTTVHASNLVLTTASSTTNSPPASSTRTSLDAAYAGLFKVEFLTVEHSVGLKIEDEFMLTGLAGVGK